jgi:steroid 5-alpha reductase family enzyme
MHFTETREVFALAGAALFVYMSLWAGVAINKKRADLADIAWGFGFVLIAWLAASLSPFSTTSFIVDLLVTIWALRLSLHIYLRHRKRAEDFRYESFKKWWQVYLKVFILQGLILYVVASPLLWINTHPHSLSWFPLFLWAVGFLIETVSDFQLASFQSDPTNRGKLLTTGLWSYVRHPNYLGEITQWWAIWLFTLPLPLGWAFIVSPILITFLIIKVSGIAPLEKKMANHPQFAEYAKKTPSLIPFSILPKKETR